MNFHEFYWADSDIESINIEYDHATLVIWNDALEKRLSVECSGFAGITNLCIWDDTILISADIYPVLDENSDFVRNLFSAYSRDYNYGGRSLSNGLIELRIELANHLSFSVYCQEIEVVVSTC